MNPRGRSRADWARPLIEASTLTVPEGEGPHPVVFQLHGCGGIRPFMEGYAQAANAAGVAAITVDSFSPRGLNRLTASCLVCTGVTLQGAQRAADVYALYEWARQQDWIDPDRIAFSGWSHGSWAIMDALALGSSAPRVTGLRDLPADPLAGLAAVVLVYPYAAFPARTISSGWPGTRPKVSALLGGKDQVVGTRYPPRALERLERDGVPVQRLVFPEATHAFEDPAANDPRARYRPDLFEEAKVWYGAQLKTNLSL